jgi:hypothetical protein
MMIYAPSCLALRSNSAARKAAPPFYSSRGSPGPFVGRGDPRAHPMLQSLVGAQIVARGVPEPGWGRQEPVAGGPPPQHPPEALDGSALWATAGQPIERGMRARVERLRDQGPPMPGALPSTSPPRREWAAGWVRAISRECRAKPSGKGRCPDQLCLAFADARRLSTGRAVNRRVTRLTAPERCPKSWKSRLPPPAGAL